MGCPGLHCSGCSGKGTSVGAIAIVLGVAVVIGWIHKSMHTISHVANHVTNDVFQVMIIAFYSVITLTLVTVGLLVAVKVRRSIIKKNEIPIITDVRNDALGNDRQALPKPIYVPSQTTIIRRPK